MDYEEEDGLDGDELKTCERCRFFRELVVGQSGECRKYAPQPGRLRLVPRRRPDDIYMPEWPEVHIADWCGDFEEHPHKAGNSWNG